MFSLKIINTLIVMYLQKTDFLNIKAKGFSQVAPVPGHRNCVDASLYREL